MHSRIRRPFLGHNVPATPWPIKAKDCKTLGSIDRLIEGWTQEHKVLELNLHKTITLRTTQKMSSCTGGRFIKHFYKMAAK